MAKLFVDYIPDRKIIEALEQYHAYGNALRSGIPLNERPPLPRSAETKKSRLLPGAVLHLTSKLLLKLSGMLGMVKAQERLAGNLIRTDDYSKEPMSCDLHNAYTRYGLSCLAHGDVTLAIQSLVYSAKIRPCPHTISFGLSSSLRNRLLPYDEAEEAIQLYDVVARRFSGREWYRHPEERG